MKIKTKGYLYVGSMKIKQPKLSKGEALKEMNSVLRDRSLFQKEIKRGRIWV